MIFFQLTTVQLTCTVQTYIIQGSVVAGYNSQERACQAETHEEASTRVGRGVEREGIVGKRLYCGFQGRNKQGIGSRLRIS